VFDGLRLSLALLTRWPLHVERVDRSTTRRAMTLAPLVGVGLGAVAGAVGIGAHAAAGGTVGALLGATLSVAMLAVLTGALHLDGWADVADALGVRGDAAAARATAKSPTLGAFGVVAIALAVVVDVAAVAVCVQHGRAMTALITSAASSRLVATCAASHFPAAASEGLGAWVARSVPRGQAVAASAAVLVICAALGALDVHARTAGAATALGAAVIGVTAGLAVCRVGVRRFDGITGDVFGAAITGATTSVYVALALTVRLVS
jgi:adenosylcobinamide-GDP ribazoletransferase